MTGLPRQLTVEMFGQRALAEEERTEELMMLHCPAKGLFDRNVLNMSGNMTPLLQVWDFRKEDKKRSVAAFSGRPED